MPLIVTPKQLSHQAELYHQLGALIAAGVTLPSALETVHRAPPTRSFRRPLKQVLELILEGSTFSEALSRVRGWLSSFDAALLRAGEQSGRLDACFNLLSTYYADRAQLVRTVINALLYPVFLLHFAIFILPFPDLFITGRVDVYLWQTVGILAPIYLGVAFLVIACQGRHGELWRSLVERAGRLIPVLGAARRQLALARLSAALEALLSAGVSIIDAWELAATASGSPALRRAVVSWKPNLVDDGQTPAEVLSASSEFPELFANLYTTGEVSGQLDDTLQRLHKYYQEEGTRKLKLLAQWIPRMLYLIVVMVIAMKILSFWTGYFQRVLDVGSEI